MYQMFVLYYTPIMLIILPILWNLIQYWLLYFNNWEKKKKKKTYTEKIYHNFHLSFQIKILAILLYYVKKELPRKHCSIYLLFNKDFHL